MKANSNNKDINNDYNQNDNIVIINYFKTKAKGQVGPVSQ